MADEDVPLSFQMANLTHANPPWAQGMLKYVGASLTAARWPFRFCGSGLNSSSVADSRAASVANMGMCRSKTACDKAVARG